MTVGSGQRLSEWLPEQGPIGVFLKTLLESPVWRNPLRLLEWTIKGYGTVPDEPSLKSSQDLPLLDMNCLATETGFPGFRLCRLLVSERGTGETGCLSSAGELWGTASTRDNKDAGVSIQNGEVEVNGLIGRQVLAHCNGIQAHAQLWATANSDDANNVSRQSGEFQSLTRDANCQTGQTPNELLRVTMPGRECCVHCCDLLATKWKDGEIELKDFSGRIKDAFRKRGWLLHSVITIWKDPVVEMQRTKAHGLLQKTLLKDSSRSRVGAPDYLLVFRKPGVNPKPIAHSVDSFPLAQWQEWASPVWMGIDQGNVLNGKFARDDKDERHICPLQLDIINRALVMWSNEGDFVFSPFAGIGSEGYCALKSGRKFIGAELKESYWLAAQQFLAQAVEERHDLFTPATAAFRFAVRNPVGQSECR